MQAASKPRNAVDGFTIVEMLIVLAIGGLIALIVFAAIPALTRNSRNNQRRQDVSTILQAVSHYELNKSGNFPVDSDLASLSLGSSLTYYSAGPSPDIQFFANQPGTVSNLNDVNKVRVYQYQICSTTTTGNSSSSGAGSLDIVALFAIETAGGSSPQCEQL